MTTDILGRDCNGKPLRAGDLVVIVNPHPDWCEQIGRSCSVLGPCEIFAKQVVLSISSDCGLSVRSPPECLSLITGTPDDEEAPEHDKVVQVEPA